MANAKKRATIKDVAALAGVSYQTVSRVINKKGEISPDTQQRVLEAAASLDFRPSRVARGLVTQRTHTVGLIISDITNPFFPEVARGVQDLARSMDYNVFLCNTDDDPAEDLQALHSLATQAVDGIILFGYYLSEDELNRFADNYRPIVLINRLVEHPSVNRVVVDNYAGAKLAVDHLIEQGHTAIGMLVGVESATSPIRRVSGFRDALATHGLHANDDWIVSGPATLTSGYDHARELLTQHPEITAVFAYNDLMALGALRACRDVGLSVPGDCAVVGFDNIQLAGMVTPSLTSIHIDKYALGQEAMARLLEMINNPDETFPPISVNPDLIIRESTVSMNAYH
ncbi:MAG: LacI family transcriptional regulator [Anaerolineae bacterium]|nr:LacI family transcriptional regulator [Anaerolineae bacterium]